MFNISDRVIEISGLGRKGIIIKDFGQNNFLMESFGDYIRVHRCEIELLEAKEARDKNSRREYYEVLKKEFENES